MIPNPNRARAHPGSSLRALARLLAVGALLAATGSAQEAPPKALTWDDFPVFVWRQQRVKATLDPGLARAFGATNLGREDDAPLAAEGLAFYVDNAAGRNDLHLDRDERYEKRWEQWYRTRDEALLLRQPCLLDPTVRERLRSTLERTLEKHAHLGLGISLGDEVSWTPYGSPEDTCLCAHCRDAWRLFLERAIAQGRAELPADFDLALASTDAARAALEQGERTGVHAWLLRREFTQSVMQDCLAGLSQRARELRPEVQRGLLGMIGRSAFGGVAVDRILPALDFAECYRVSDARELLFTLRRPGQRVVQTIFFDEKLVAGASWFAFESWMRGADALVIWSDLELRAHPEYARTLERATARIRELRRLEPRFAPRPGGVAIVNDENSIAYGWLVDARLDGPTWPRRLQGWQEERGSREKSLRAWLRVLEDCGAMPGAIPLSQIGAATVKRFPVLVLNHLRVMDASGQRNMLEFMDAGGTLLVRGEIGVITPFGKRDLPEIEPLSGEYPGRVHTFGAELDDYLAERVDGGAGLRERITARLAKAREFLAPWRMTTDGSRVPWLSTWSELPDASVIGAALPNLAEAHEREQLVPSKSGATRARLSPITAHIEPAAGFEVQWLNPADAQGRDCKLAAGEAAVFRLVPTPKK